MDNAEKKREFLSIESYAEFDRRRNEFEGLFMDKEVCNHFTKLLKKEGVRFGTQDPNSTEHIDYYR